MSEPAMTSKEKIRLLKRSYGLCHRLAPTYIGRKCAGSLLVTVFNYVEIYLSGLIVDMITTGNRSLDAILKAIVIYIVVRTACLEVFYNLLVFSKTSQLASGFIAKSKMLLAEKCADLDYVYIENPDTHRQKWEAENFLCGGASRWNGMGKLLYQTQGVIQPVAAILIGSCLMFKPLFLTPACADGFMGFVQSVWAVPLLFAVYALICAVRQKFSVKAGKIWADYFADKKVISLAGSTGFTRIISPTDISVARTSAFMIKRE